MDRPSALAFALKALALILLVAVLMLLALRNSADAHSWYSEECCNEQDCAPAEPGEVEITAEGYFVRSVGIVVAFNDERLRPSRDGEFHVCKAATAVGLFLICLYVPLNT